MKRVAGVVVGIAAAANATLAFPVGYLGLLTVVAIRTDRRGRNADGSSSAIERSQAHSRFVVLVPAHNEASTLPKMLAGMAAQNYPASQFSVHVVADNCTDDTASIARAGGAVVHERFNLDERGKGPALNWLIDRLVERCEPFDVAVFVDADTTAAPGFLAALDERFRLGAVAVQGHYGVREAFESTATTLRYCALACRHHLRPTARTALGGSCGLFGNGMAFARSLIVDRRWSGHLVEDMEFQLELLLDGVYVEYEPAAAVLAEMPHTLAASTTQHQRWEQGRRQIRSRFVPLLARRVVRPVGRRRRVAAVDALADMIVPPLSLLAAATGAAATLSAAAAVVAPTAFRRSNALFGAGLVVVVSVHVATALRLVHAPAAAYRALLQAPRLAAWKFMLMVRPARSDGEWIRTKRNAEGDS